MTGGRIILPPTNPSLDSNGNPVSGATLTYYQNGTTTPVTVYSDRGLTTPLTNPVTADAAGVFPQVWAPNGVGYSVKWSRTGFADVTYNDIYPDLDSAATGSFISTNQAQVQLGSNIGAAFGTVGVGLIENSFTQTDSTTAAGTVPTAYSSVFGATTFATPTNAITITNAFGAYFKDPVAGSHVTLTNKYAIGADSIRCVNNLSVGGTLAVAGLAATIGSGTGSPYLTVNGGGSGGNNMGVSFQANGSQVGSIYYDVSSGAVRIASGTRDPAVTIAANTGALAFKGYGSGTLTTDASGNVTASSDGTLKDIQGPYSRGVADIVKIDTTLWKWNKASGMDHSTVQASYTAQAVQAGVPEAVSVGPDEKLTVFDGALIAALINCVKELNARIAVLEAKP